MRTIFIDPVLRAAAQFDCDRGYTLLSIFLIVFRIVEDSQFQAKFIFVFIDNVFRNGQIVLKYPRKLFGNLYNQV
jgi:hypothetical protein